MGKKIRLLILILIYVAFYYAIAFNNNVIADIVSPTLLFILTGYVFAGFVFRQKIKKMKWFGWMITLSVLNWAVCEFWWGIQTLILHTDPEQNFITIYGYSLTNLFMCVAIGFIGYQDLKKMNKIQAMLDTLVVSVCIAVLLWLFVFEQNNDKAMILLSDPVSLASLIADIFLYAWANVWSLSTRITKPPFYHRVFVSGGLVFVVTDFVYYYINFYTGYEPNSWNDGAYMLAFSILALSAYFKLKEKGNTEVYICPVNKKTYFKVGFEVLTLLAPIIVFIFKRSQIQYFLLLVVVLLIYYILINFTQKSIFQEQLLELEKKNVSELEKKVEERTEAIIRLVNTDFISGLYSRRYFESKLAETIRNLKKSERIALLYIDQNKSKSIKYLYGKDTAEKLQKLLAKTLQNIVDEYKGLIASHGDDVFVIMLLGYDANTEAKEIADQIINRCNELFLVDNHAIKVTVNIGISCYPIDTAQPNDLLKNADISMMQARAKGFNHIQIYNDSIGNLTYNRHRVEMKLKKVIFDQEFQLYYQAQAYCEKRSLCGFEALIRWFEGGKTMISPLDFIPVAEETGMIVPLGYWIIENAAKQHDAWKKEKGREYKIAVNVSSKQLVESDFVQKVSDILKKYHVSPEFFEIEITESQQIENSIHIVETLNRIKQLGISLAIDDFGTGYSSLYYIKNIPADRIKIAKELVDNIENDIDSKAIVQMVLSIAKVKGISVIAEGVETKEQWDILEKLGCDEIQGYYFAKPHPADEIDYLSGF